MIKDYFLILTRVLAAWILYIFGIRAGSKKLYYSSIYLFGKQSFRLPQSAKSEVLVVFKSYYNTVKQIFSKTPEVKRLSTGNVGILDSSFQGMDTRLNYLNYSKVDTNLLLSRENLNGALNFQGKILAFVLATKIFSFFWLGSFSKNRAAYALLISEAVEWFNLLSILKKEKVNRLYVFSIYEKDSNILAYFLMKRNIAVSKITSEVPLTFANKIIVTNELILCFNYQLEEVEEFKKSMFYDSVQTWLPEAQVGYLEKYSNKVFNIESKKIGFYSSAFWLRKKLNHSIADVGSYDAEETVLKYLAEYISIEKNLKLVIFPHPYENKSEEVFKNTIEHYRSVMGENVMERVEIAGRSEKSTLSFDKVNIGISLFSTVMFERINLGFKTILTPIDKTDFPLKTSPFRNICAYSKKELFEKLEKNLPLSEGDFFGMNKIGSYVSTSAGVKYNLI